MRATLFTIMLVSAALGRSQGYVFPYTTYDLVPNWTATDINGNVHTLYDYLDDGYSVVLDFSTTWCAPCAALTASKALDSLQTLHGPGSADPKVVVFFIESDPTTDMADLDGSSMGTPDGNTIMDWITGHTVNIIDDASIAQLYHVNGYPTVYTICPSRMIIGGLQYGGYMSDYLAQVNACGHYSADSPNDAAVLKPITMVQYCAGPAVALSTTLQNLGTEPLTSATIEAYAEYQNEVVSTTTWSGNLATYGSVEVQLPPWDGAPDGQYIEYRLTTPDDDATNDTTQSEYMYVSSGVAWSTDIDLQIRTDAMAQAVNGYITRYGDLGTVVVLEQILEGDLENNTMYTFSPPMLHGACYHLQLSMDESFVDGNGLFRLLQNGETFLDADDCSFLQFNGRVYYSAFFTIEAQTSVTGTPNSTTTRVVLLGDGSARLIMPEGTQAEDVVIFDGSGRSLRMQRLNAQDPVVDLGGFAPGVYTFVIRTADQRSSVKVVVTQ